jgi:hypothetical protein
VNKHLLPYAKNLDLTLRPAHTQLTGARLGAKDLGDPR